MSSDPRSNSLNQRIDQLIQDAPPGTLTRRDIIDAFSRNDRHPVSNIVHEKVSRGSLRVNPNGRVIRAG